MNFFRINMSKFRVEISKVFSNFCENNTSYKIAYHSSWENICIRKKLFFNCQFSENVKFSQTCGWKCKFYQSVSVTEYILHTVRAVYICSSMRCPQVRKKITSSPHFAKGNFRKILLQKYKIYVSLKECTSQSLSVTSQSFSVKSDSFVYFSGKLSHKKIACFTKDTLAK